MATSKDSGAKKATAADKTKVEAEREEQRQAADQQTEQPDIQEQADRVLSGQATTVNTTGAAPGQSPMGEMEPRERSGPIGARSEEEAGTDRK